MGCASGCAVRPTPLYLRAGLRLGFEAPAPGGPAFEEYVSDPAKPVPFRARPIQPVGYDETHTWPQWLVDDQREASGRPDVVAFVSDPLEAPVKISGQPAAHLVASTGGTDSDWVVKLIDVFPDQVAAPPGWAATSSRSRWTSSAGATARAWRARRPSRHRIMVQIQSNWFPLYDRNPQTFVPSIFWAKPEDYRKATQAPGPGGRCPYPFVISTRRFMARPAGVSLLSSG